MPKAKVILLTEARLQLRDIAMVHKLKVGPRSAKRITDQILKSLRRLEEFPQLGVSPKARNWSLPVTGCSFPASISAFTRYKAIRSMYPSLCMAAWTMYVGCWNKSLPHQINQIGLLRLQTWGRYFISRKKVFALFTDTN